MDKITTDHCQRMAQLIETFATALGCSENKIQELKLFAQIHDIGKTQIPKSILFKPGELTTEEIEIMREHSRSGCEIAEAISCWILHHHEWFNGCGYPLKLSGENIPLECRMLAIIDAYDAMTNDRPYRKKLNHEEALQVIQSAAGTQFDPNLVTIFIEIMKGTGAQKCIKKIV